MTFLRTTPLLFGLLLLSTMTQATNQAKLAAWINNVVTQHPSLYAAKAASSSSKALLHAANQPLFNPEIELEFERTDVDTKTFGISQTIDWGDKQSAQSRIAYFKWQQSLSELAIKQQQVSADALLALAQYQSSIEILNVANKRMDSMTQFINIAKQRFNAGDLTEIDLSLAQLTRSEANFQLANAESKLIASTQTLLVLLGSNTDEALNELPLMLSTPNAPKQSVSDVDALLDSLPEMKLALARMNIARASIKLRQREQRPNPTIGMTTGKEGDEHLSNITFSMPLFVRNNFSAEVNAANEQLIVRQREAINTRRLLAAKLKTTTQTLALNRLAWLQWQATGRISLFQQEPLLKRLWQVGELSTADYLVRLKQSLDTQASAIEHKTQLWQSWTQWLIASGEINQWITHNVDVASSHSEKQGNGEQP